MPQTQYLLGIGRWWRRAALTSLLLLLALSATASAEDEFCGPGVKPPTGIATLSSRPCCTDQLCLCDSKICGGENVAFQNESTAPPPAPERIPTSGKRSIAPPASGRAKSNLGPESLNDYLPEAPTPPPPRTRTFL